MTDTETKRTFSLQLGAIAEPINVQLRKQGIAYDPDLVRRFQSEADAISTVRLAKLVPWATCETAYKRLLANIGKRLSFPA